MLFGKRVLIGLDIGRHSVKAAVLDQNKNDIINLLESEILPGRDCMEQIPGDDAVAEKVRGILSKYTGADSKLNPVVYSSLQGDGAICSYLELPKLKKQEEETAIQSLTRKNIPFSIEEASIIYIPVPALSSDKDKKGIFFIAIKQDAVKKHQELLKKCGLPENNFHVYIRALINEFIKNHGRTPDKFTAIVNAGSYLTSVLIIKDGFPYYARDFAVAGCNFTYAFQMGKQSSWQEAENYKLGYDASAKEVPVEPPLIKWLDNVKKSIDTFTKQYSEYSPVIDKVYLSGGTARWKNLDTRMTEHINIPVETDKWAGIKPPENPAGEGAGTYNIAIGTALLI